jgi:hypothetical protein
VRSAAVSVWKLLRQTTGRTPERFTMSIWASRFSIPLQQAEVFRRVDRIEFAAGENGGASAMELQSPNGGDHDDGVGLEPRATALDVPEFLIADVGRESALGDEVVAERGADTVRDDGALSDGDVGERTGVDQHGLAFERLHQRGVDGPDEPGGHGAVDFEVGGGDGLAGPRVGDDDPAETARRSARSEAMASTAMTSEATVM